MNQNEALKNSASNAILGGSLWRGVFRFGAPMCLAMLLHGAFNLVDTFFIGQLENARIPLAAIGNADPILMLAAIFGNGISTASVAIIAQSQGAGGKNITQRAASQSLLILCCFSLCFGVFGAIYAREIGYLMGAREQVLEQVASYLRLMFSGIFTMILLLQFTSILRAAGNARGPTLVLILTNVLNIVADPFLIFGWFGLPQMGLLGAGWATVGARLLGCIIAGWLCFKSNGKLLPHTLQLWKPDSKMLKKLLQLGLPNSLQLVIRVAAILFLVALVNQAFTTPQDQSATAAFGLGIRIDMLVLFTAMGWGAAASTYVGQNLGAKQPRRAAQATWITVIFTSISLVPIIFGLQYFAGPIVQLFVQDQQAVATITQEYLGIMSLSYGFAAVSVVLSLALNGAGSTRTPAVIDFVVYVLLIVPGAYYLVYEEALTREGLWIVIAAGNLLLAIVYVVLFRLGKWQKKSLGVF